MRTFILVTLSFLLLASQSILAQEKSASDPWSATVLHWVESGRPKFHIQFESLTLQNSRVRLQFDHFPTGSLRDFEQYWVNYKPDPLLSGPLKLQVNPGVIYTNKGQLLAGADVNLSLPKWRLDLLQRSYLGGTDKHLTFLRWTPVKVGDMTGGLIWHMNAKSIRSPDTYLGPTVSIGKTIRFEGGLSIGQRHGYFYGGSATFKF